MIRLMFGNNTIFVNFFMSFCLFVFRFFFYSSFMFHLHFHFWTELRLPPKPTTTTTPLPFVYTTQKPRRNKQHQNYNHKGNHESSTRGKESNRPIVPENEIGPLVIGSDGKFYFRFVSLFFSFIHFHT